MFILQVLSLIQTRNANQIVRVVLIIRFMRNLKRWRMRRMKWKRKYHIIRIER
jgi:hypothetical protein